MYTTDAYIEYVVELIYYKQEKLYLSLELQKCLKCWTVDQKMYTTDTYSSCIANGNY